MRHKTAPLEEPANVDAFHHHIFINNHSSTHPQFDPNSKQQDLKSSAMACHPSLFLNPNHASKFFRANPFMANSKYRTGFF
jgi:hypothetical protein